MATTKGSFFRSPSFKFMVIGTLSLLLLIPTAMIRKLISEREMRSTEAVNEISESWSLSQTITGPFISIPTERIIQRKKEDVVINNTFHLLPESLDISGEVIPLEKHRGIFTAVVYDSDFIIKGSFDLSNEDLNALFRKNHYRDKAFLCIGIDDLRGIGNASQILVNGKPVEIKPGLFNYEVANKGIHAPLDMKALVEKGKLEFEIMLPLKGSSSIYINPIGKTTDVKMTSTWPDPSFSGDFLPAEKSISSEGFNAIWEVNYLNRNYPQSWYDKDHSIGNSALGVHFLVPVDHYQKSERSVKYAFMFIALSFLVFFLTEVILKTRIHPIQYLLVGFVLIIFYTLLVSLAEQIGFNLAYGISTLAVLSLVGFYMKSSTQSGKVGLITGLLLAALYGFLFTTLQLQELALLMGSIGLFLILAVIMIVSRKINWYKEEE